MPRPSIERLLSKPTSGVDDGYDHDGVTVVKELIGLGVLQSFTKDNSIDIPDVYRYEFEMKRKGHPKKD